MRYFCKFIVRLHPTHNGTEMSQVYSSGISRVIAEECVHSLALNISHTNIHPVVSAVLLKGGDRLRKLGICQYEVWRIVETHDTDHFAQCSSFTNT